MNHSRQTLQGGYFSLGHLHGNAFGSGGGGGSGLVNGTNFSSGSAFGEGDGFGNLIVNGSAIPDDIDGDGYNEANATSMSISTVSGKSEVESGGRGSGIARNSGNASSFGDSTSYGLTNAGKIFGASFLDTRGVGASNASSTGGMFGPSTATGTTASGGGAFGTIAGFFGGAKLMSEPTPTETTPTAIP